MLKRTVATLALGALATIGIAAGVTVTSNAQAPAAPAQYFSGSDIAAVLASSLAERPEMGASLITTTDHYRINLITRTEPHGAIVHRPGTELHFIVDGAGTLTTGGTVNRPADGGMATIVGGVSRAVTKGDAILIPEGTPHHYTAMDSPVTYLEVRFNVPVE